MRLSRCGGYAKAGADKRFFTAEAEQIQKTGGRRVQPSGTVISVQETAPKLSKEEPLFKLRSGGTFAIQTHPKLQENGKVEDVPTNFIRVDKNRVPVKMRKRAKRNARLLAQKTT